MRSGHVRIAAVLPILVAGLAATPARAQALQDDFWFQLSGYWANVDTDIQVSEADAPDSGTEIDLEEDLALDDNSLLISIFAGARLGSGFQIGADYYSLGRDSTNTIDRDIVIEDVTYPANVDVTTGFDSDIYRLTVGWAFARGENYEVGGAIGLHATDITVSIEGQGTVDGSAVQIQQRRQDFLAPLPTLGLFANFEVMPGLVAGARVDFLSLSVDDYDGRLINLQASLAYRITRNIGVGVLYRYVDYRVDVEKEEYVGRFAYEFNGPALFVEVGF
jgi:hypothetical protein